MVNVPLILPPPLPPVPGNVEVMIARARIAYTHLINSELVEEESEDLTTILISMAPTETSRRSARAAAATFLAAEIVFEQAPTSEWSAWISGLLAQRNAASICIVLALPEYDLDTSRQVVALLQSLKESAQNVQLTAAVSASPSAWILGEEVRYVWAQRDHVHGTALRMFSIFANLMAPGHLCAFDANDLSVALGTADAPTRLVDAVWFSESCQLALVSDSDRDLLASSDCVSIIPSSCSSSKSFVRLVAEVKRSTKPLCNLVISATFGLILESSNQITQTWLLCTQELAATDGQFIGGRH